MPRQKPTSEAKGEPGVRPSARAEVLRNITARLARAGVPSPRADAEWLLLHVLKAPRSALLSAEQVLLASQLEALERLVRRRERREPLQWLLGSVPFHDLELKVRPGVLIPRPETERFVELISQELSTKLSTNPLRVVDIGCGSGAIALSLKRRYPHLMVVATDISSQAIALTLENAQLHHLELEVHQTSLLNGLSGQFDAILSNPPYLPEGDTVEAEVALEPPEALYSGVDGLDVARHIAALARERLRPHGLLALELDPRNAPTLRAELEAMGFSAQLEADLAGRERFVIAHLTPTEPPQKA